METKKSIYDTIDNVISTVGNYKREYIDYYKKCIDQNFRNLLLSVIEQKNEHLKRIKEIKAMGNLETLFSFKPLNIENTTIKYSPGIKYLDFLKALIERHDIMSRIYKEMMEQSLNQDIKLLFKRLEFEINKQKSIISSRYELEKINMG